MNNIYDILARLDAIEEGLGRDQERVQQLPALFKPKSASPALAGAYPTLNATRGYLVGEDDARVRQQVEITVSPDDIAVIERASQRMPGAEIFKHIIDEYETVAGIDREGDASLKLRLSSDDRVAIESVVEKFGYSLDETGIFRHIMRELDQQSVGEEEELGTVFEPGIENTAEYRQGHSAARDAKNPHQEGTTAWTRWLKGRMDRIGPKAAQGGFMKNLQEEMTEIEEDMLSKVKKDLTNYLDMLEKKVRVDRDLRDKAVDAVIKGQAEEAEEVDSEPVEEDPTTQDTESEPPPAPQQDVITAESYAVKTVTMEDGVMLEIHGDEGRGFEVRREGRSMPSRFRSLAEAETAIELFRSRRKRLNTDQDYLEER